VGSLECLYSLDSIRAALGFAGSRPLLLEVSTAMSYLNKSVLSPRQEAGLGMELDATNWQYSPFIFLYLLAVPIFWIVMLRFYYKQKKEGKTSSNDCILESGNWSIVRGRNNLRYLTYTGCNTINISGRCSVRVIPI